MRKKLFFVCLWVLLDFLAGYGGLFPLPEIMAAAQATPANPISSQQITFPVFTLVPQPATGASVQLVGNPGPKAIFYWVVAKYTVGNANLAGPFAITNAPNTLSAANGVRVLPILASGATSYDLLKTSSTVPPGGACACAVATGVAVGTFTNDQSDATGAYTVNTLDLNTLNMTIQNEVQSAGVSHLILRQGGVQVQDLSAPTPGFPLLAPNGTAGAPSYSFSSSSNSGMFFGSSLLHWSVGGTDMMTLGLGPGFPQLFIPVSGSSLCFAQTVSIACFWHLGTSQVGLGTATQGDFSGTFRTGAIIGGNTSNISGFNNITSTVQTSGPKYVTVTNCSSAASPAVCAVAPAGRVVIAAAATTVVVNTTIVTANSEIFVKFDESLTGLGTCNTAAASESATYFISARVAGTSFTIKTSSAPVANPACLSFLIFN